MSKTTEAHQVAALRRVINHPAAWAKLMADEERQQAILDMPHCATILEDAIIDADNARYEKEEEEARSAAAHEEYLQELSADCFADLDPAVTGEDAEDDEPKRGNFGMRMAALRKAKTQAKGKMPAGKPAKKTTKKAEPRVFEFRAKHYKAHSVCKIVRGKEKGTSANTTAFERVCPDGEVIDRVIIGSTQAEIILSIPEAQRVKMLKSLQR